MFPVMTETSKQPALDVDAAEMRFEEEVELSFSPIPSFEAGKRWRHPFPLHLAFQSVKIWFSIFAHVGGCYTYDWRGLIESI